MYTPCQNNLFSGLQRVLEDWSAVFIMMFEIAPNYLEKIRLKVPADPNRLVSISNYGDEVVKKGKEVRRSDMLDLGMQELRTYFRLFLLSSILLMFMFCSRISRSKYKSVMPSMVL